MSLPAATLAAPDPQPWPGSGEGPGTGADHPRPGGPPAGAGPLPRDAGMATAEYAIATLAACGFAGLLVTILRGTEVRGLLLGIVRQALTLG